LWVYGFRYYFTLRQECFSPFPHGTGSLSVTGEYLALSRGRDRFKRDCTCPALLGCPSRKSPRFRLQAFHLLWRTVPGASTTVAIGNFPAFRRERHDGSHNPGRTTDAAFNVRTGLGCSPFARRYLGNHYCCLFLRVLRCFSSPRSLRPAYVFSGG
jgi:hypothetical protein